jgi:hypothetical protein
MNVSPKAVKAILCLNLGADSKAVQKLQEVAVAQFTDRRSVP